VNGAPATADRSGRTQLTLRCHNSQGSQAALRLGGFPFQAHDFGAFFDESQIDVVPGNQECSDMRSPCDTLPWKRSPQINNKETKENMSLDTLEKLYISELRDLYSAENQLLKALPKMAKGASSPELKDAFEKHLEQTKGHVERLEELFEQRDESPKGKPCKAMKGLIEEGSEILKEEGEDSVLDAGMIVAAQKVEHYEIASYGSVRTFANLLGKDDEAELLQATLDEERETNEILNQLAETVVNPEAVTETELVETGSKS
jgi:ferritin-like metal-binding protein YciE